MPLAVSLVRAGLLAGLLAIFTPGAAAEAPDGLAQVLDRAEALAPLETVIVAHEGMVLAERGYRGHSVSAPTNIKSASKVVISALVGLAIERGLLESVDQPIVELLPDDLPADPDPLLGEVTVSHLLSMQAGLERTSGEFYGRWVASPNWVRAALDKPFVDVPGGEMLYSTGSTHLLSAILTRASGRSTLALARDWLAPIEGFAIAAWDRDPQGIYLGGNQMAMSPRALLAFGEVYRRGGLLADGVRLIPEDWIAQSWTERTVSVLTHEGYGYGWFHGTFGGEPGVYAWGFGGQMLYIVPALQLTVVMTSDDTIPSESTGYLEALHALAGEIVTAVRP